MKSLEELDTPRLIHDEAEEPLNKVVPVEALYHSALQEVKRMTHDLMVFKKRVSKYEQPHLNHVAALQSSQEANVRYKAKIKELEGEVFNLCETIFKLGKEVERLNLQLLKNTITP